ncbi:Phosphoenolpyruvate/pyruvate domain-containing protein [Laetiporus sulphureus 93-53]|uniref:Phosphoenolpyruvate/pyruvate domain-containing protein n=1 Tax=Laetiporus sulphureus 93-53 TaxID=1314785 RepID=A0A165BIV3_9APHY|nr:Phosphoenolpyruvate/pyruvate domain-containing protein [Laetiporus sulphureus 93-53]KZT01140.1 Phosphoenolpyruvate/pyruvate domain-containing protein [Laetiporus sulphureus 93-53]
MASASLVQALRASKPAFGAWITMPGALHARTVAASSPHLSWITLDCEHGMISLLPGVSEAIQAVSSLGSSAPSAIVRVPATGACADTSTSWQIKQALDAGARGIMVPMVSTSAQAQAVVAAARFPPKGIRGFGSPFTDSVWGITPSEYLATANDGILVLVQIETRDAMTNLDGILSVDGLDGVLIGPYDLSLSHGYPPPSPDPHPEVELMIQKIREGAHAKGKKCAMFCTTGSQAAKRAEQGFDMINVISDASALTQGLAQNLATAAGQIAPPKSVGY